VLGVAGALGALLMLLWQWGEIHEYGTYKRDARTSTPGLSALFAREVVLLDADESACLEPVTFAADTGQARVRVQVPKRRAPRLDLEMRAPGYDERVTVPPMEPRAEGEVRVEFPQPRREVTGEFCFHNRGPTPINLIGTNEGRSLLPVELTIDGRPKDDANLELQLLRAGGHSLASRRTEIVDRASAFTAGLVPAWLLWPVALLLVLLPLIVAVLFGVSVTRAEAARADRGDGRGPPASRPS
jgi:hypothetical protein